MDRVPRKECIALGLGGLAIFFGSSAIGALTTPVYQMTLGVNPTLFTLALAIPSLWDAVIDLGVGRISDSTRTRFGRRRPFVISGALLSALCFALLWFVPQDASELTAAAYLFTVATLFYSAFTLFAVPYQGLLLEVTADYDERTRVASYPTFLGKLAEAGYIWLIPLAGITAFGSLLIGMRWIGSAIGVVVFGVLGVLPGLFVKERSAPDVHARPTGLRSSLAQAWKLRAVRILLMLIIVQAISGMVAASLDYYLLVYYMFDGDIAQGSVWKAVLSSGYAAAGMAGVVGVRILSRRFEKHTVLILAYTLLAVGGVVKWFVFTPGLPALILLDPLFCAFIYAAIGTLFPAMIADICDEDEAASGLRREASYAAIFDFVRKVVTALGLFGSGLTLSLSGFDETLGGDQSPATFLTIRAILAGTTVATALAAIALLRNYPLTRTVAGSTRTTLEQRRGTRRPTDSNQP